jgi:hypothetical protein
MRPALLTQIEIFEDIPAFGDATGALLNLAVAHSRLPTPTGHQQGRLAQRIGHSRQLDKARGWPSLFELQVWSKTLVPGG